MKLRFIYRILSVCSAVCLTLSCVSVPAAAAVTIPGDLNCDGQVNVADAVLLARLNAEDITLHLTENGIDNADCNLDGQSDAEDLAFLLKRLANLLPDFLASPLAQFDLSAVPPYDGEPYAAVNGNIPFFRPEDYPKYSFEYYSPLDALGRCGVCVSCIGQDLMPTEKRGEIGAVKPTGWHLVRYDDIVEGKYLYNRCHLIGFQLTAENANHSNLITGTRYLNTVGMLPFENETAQYIRSTANHVLYRVTPVFEGENLVAAGVLMEAESVEDHGAGLRFNVFCYNVQPQIVIDYATGESRPANEQNPPIPDNPPAAYDFIVNRNTKKFHRTDCPNAADIKENNRLEYSGTREELIEQGYTPCKQCNP